MKNTEEIKALSIQSLLENEDSYIIPIYQRNYAWNEKEIEQLILDIVDSMKDNSIADKMNYYIGTLVVYKRDVKIYEVIDGQQRLTTLALLIAYLRNNGQNLKDVKMLNLTFDSRKSSENTLAGIYKNDDLDVLSTSESANPAIVEGYNLIKKHLKNSKLDEFAQYLLNSVQIMRVEVPHDTDLNHYFEIMNSRGEQLEKHEVLKAKLMSKLNDASDRKCFNHVWEACSNMERYIQTSFSIAKRDKLFTRQNWNLPAFKHCGNKSIFNLLAEDKASEDNLQKEFTLSLADVLSNNYKTSEKTQTDTNNDAPERFNSIINFPNFLLHVLRIQTGEDVPLDDKKLIESFERYILNEEEKDLIVQKIKTFIYTLLKCKFLYDKYVIKREFLNSGDNWSLKQYKWRMDEKRKIQSAYYSNSFGKDAEDTDTVEQDKSTDISDTQKQKSILMLQAAFHVSTPTLAYKYWLNGTLDFLFVESENAIEVSPDDYLKHLEKLAKLFVFDRFLNSTNPKDYYAIVYNKTEIDNLSVAEEKLNFNTIENNFVFNYLDYLLWKANKDKKLETYLPATQERDLAFYKAEKIDSFDYTFRSSVEHYYPQNPRNKEQKLLEKDVINSFGNLCLISHSKNSRLSNDKAQDKKGHYRDNMTIDSIKQHIMMSYTEWDKENIQDHNEKMLLCLKDALQ